MHVTDMAPLRRMRILPRRSVGWIGVDVGARSVKVAQVERDASGWRIARSLILDTGLPRPVDGEPQWTPDLSRTLRGAVRGSLGFSGHTAACAISMSHGDLRVVEVPGGSDDELREMILQELEVNLGQPVGDREFEFWPVAAKPGGGQPLTQWHVLSLPTPLARAAGVGLLRAGLACEVLDAVPLCLARAVVMSPDAPGEAPVGVLDWGYSAATFGVVAGGRMTFTRVLRGCGLEDLLLRMGKGLGLTLDESTQLLAAYGVPDHESAASLAADIQAVVADLCGESLACLTEELQKTLSYLRLQHPALSPGQLWMFGGGAATRNITGLLAAKIGIPVRAWRIPQRPSETGCPAEMLGVAAALSALAWTT